MNAPAIETHGLTKRYGETLGLEGLDLTVERGEIFGYLGPNASGKTTTIRLLLDLIRPSRGSASLLGRPPSDAEMRRRVGYLPGDLVLDLRLTGRQTLDFLGALSTGCVTAKMTRRRRELCDRLALSGTDLDRPVREASKGTRQKLGLAAAFQHDPELVILDEPTSNLDPLVREAVFDLLLEAGRREVTVFQSSHVLSEVDRTCTRVGILRKGRLAALASIDEFRRTASRLLVVRFEAAAPLSELDLPGVEIVQAEGDHAVLRVSGDLNRLLQVLSRHRVRHLALPEATLEDAFLAIYRGEDGR